MLSEVFRRTYGSTLNSKLTEEFWVSNSGIYAIKVLVKAKTWWQNLLSFLKRYFSDDELKVSVDNSKEKLSWNGNDIRGLRKTGVLLSKLSSGKHQLLFEPKNTPLLESVEIYEITEKECNLKNILEQSIEDGERRPWLEIAFNKTILKHLSLRAFAESGKFYGITDRDDDDLKIIVDERIIRNEESKSHLNWYWCGQTLKGSSKTLEIRPEIDREVKTIRLWADRSPKIESLNLTLEAKQLRTTEEIKEKIISEAKRLGYNPKILLRLAEIESHFNPLVTSPDGHDKGIFQLRENTLEEIRKISGREINPYDAEDNIEGGLIYFDYLYKKYKGGYDALKTTLVAWNKGPTYVRENYPLDFDTIPDTTKKLVDFVLVKE